MPGFEGLLAGRTLCDRYRIEEVIGRGGFAAVYRASDERLGRTVAVKVTTFSATNPETRDEVQKRFRREARAAASLHHPNVVTVYDFGTDPVLGLEFFVMELLQGEDLAHRLARPIPIPMRVALRMLRDAAWGVDAGHRAGLVHRDIKPGNIFLARRDRPGRFRVCVLDFGIARPALSDEATQLTRAGGMLLSPAYASPEQLRGDLRVSPASDVFSLGVIGYELLTRDRPFPGNRLQAPPGAQPAPVPLRERNPEVPPEVAEAIHRALAEDPAERFATAGAFAEALAAAEPPMEPRDRPTVVAAPISIAEAEPEPHVADEPDPAATMPDAPAPVAMPVPPPEHRAPADAPTVHYAPEDLARRQEPAARGARRRVPRAAGLAVLMLLATVSLALAAWLAVGRDGERPAARDRAARGPVARRETPAPVVQPPEPFAPADSTESAAPPSTGVPKGASGARPGPVAGTAPGTSRQPAARSPRTAAPAPSTPKAAAPSTGAPRVAVRPTQPERTPPRSVPVSRPAPTPSAPAPAAASGAAGAMRLNREGEALFERNNVAGAVARFRLAVQAAPNNAYYHNNLGWALFEMGAIDEAGRVLEETLRLDPRRDIAYANLGEVRAAQGDTAAAIAAYERFVELNRNPRREQIALGKLRRLRGVPPGGTR
jgi:tRNA A-37 threonylcarbamoyl transferase component Bud32/cytochrome c-type biogenesis protein CcmH/NrfG